MWWELWLGASAAFALFAMVRREKTAPENALKNPARRRILHFVYRRPGARLDDLWRVAGVSRSTTQYHLVVLRRIGQLQAVGMNGDSRYFPSDWPSEAAHQASLILRGRIFDVAALLLDRPGFCQKDAVKLLHLSRNAFYEYATELRQTGLLEEERDHKLKRYYPTAQLRSVMELVTRWSADDREGLSVK